MELRQNRFVIRLLIISGILPPGIKDCFLPTFYSRRCTGKISKTWSRNGILDELKKATLAGRGGAFFPTWKKWAAAKDHQSATKYVICNADEGEPGTFKDRVLINTQTKSMIEGMIICGYTIGAEYGIIYLRGEYRWLKNKLGRSN